jgi:hypothetical protein
VVIGLDRLRPDSDGGANLVKTLTGEELGLDGWDGR